MLKRSTILLYPFIIAGIATSIAMIVSAISSWPEQEKDPVPIKTFYIFLAIMITASLAIMTHNLFCNSLYEEKRNISVNSTDFHNIVIIAALVGAIIAVRQDERIADSTTEQQAPAEGSEMEENDQSASQLGIYPATNLGNVTSGPDETQSTMKQS